MSGVGVSDERARTGAGLTDAVTFSFADPAAEVYGLARLGLSGEGAERRGSALALLFRGRAPVAAFAEGDIEVAADAGWEKLALPGLAASVEVPLERWSLQMRTERHAFALTFTALSPPAAHGEVGGMEGYEQLCRVEGEVVSSSDDAPVRVTGLGQRGHTWGAPDWKRLESVHTVTAWLGDGRPGVAVGVARAAGAKGHGDAARWGALLRDGEAVGIDDPRVSTTYDADGRQRRAGLELWVGEDDDRPLRAAGMVLCGSTLELGSLRLDCAFMRWTMEGASGVGRYDVLRRAG